MTFLLLAFCFTAMLYLAFFSSDFVIVGHVLLLITIGVVLFVLLNRSHISPHMLYTLCCDEQFSEPQFPHCRFLAETGFVPVEQQMKEIGIHKTETTEKDKAN
jgi:hypothetical protein